jgi:hypothetical protein
MKTRNSLISFTLSVFVILLAMLNSCSTRFINPPSDLSISDLQGVWIARYSKESTDIITINSDTTYNQVFKDDIQNYVFDSGWSTLTLEDLPNGMKRLHLDGARYYAEGIFLAETNGRKNPDTPCLEEDCTWGLQARLFYDPFADELIQMVDRLILVVLVDPQGNLVLHHLWTSSDRGFLIISWDREVFYRDAATFP